MTFRELLVMVRLYRAAPADLRRWADQQLPDLREAAELTEDKPVAHVITGPVRDYAKYDTYRVGCSCGWRWSGGAAELEAAMREHVGSE